MKRRFARGLGAPRLSGPARLSALALLVGLVGSACGPAPTSTGNPTLTSLETASASPTAPVSSPTTAASSPPTATPSSVPVGGVYASTVGGELAPQLRDLEPVVYVADEGSADVTLIDPLTYDVIGRLKTGLYPEHVIPDWDLSRLYVSNMSSSTLTILDPRSRKAVGTIKVVTPYDVYFTPDGSRSVVVNDWISPAYRKLNGLYFYDRSTWQQLGWVNVPWMGADDLDMSADGSYLLLSCEYSGMIAKIDTASMEITGSAQVGGLPRDVRLAPDGASFLVTNESLAGVTVVDPTAMAVTAFVPTGAGAHGLEFSRDATQVYVNNRAAGSISVIDLASLKVVATWKVGGSPDEMVLSPDGSLLWISNRYNDNVTVVDIATGSVIKTIAVGAKPHGITYWPLPGRFAIGQNGNMR